ncbi:MAG: twin-arginine translocase subunit TatC [Acidimicrobiales bacterium]
MSAATVTMDGDDSRMSLIEHLTELRDRLIKIVLAVVLGMVVAFLLYDQIFDFLLDPYLKECTNSVSDCKLLALDPLEGFGVRMKLSAYGGIFLAMPVILWQLWRFITPGLYDHEKRYAIPFMVSALTLFLLGAGIAYYTLPQALSFLQQIGGDNIVTAYAPGKYFTLISYMMLAFGVGFEFPIVLVFAQMMGVITPQGLRKARRYAIVGICVLVAVITPSGDPISMVALSGPMVLFYEVSILIGRVLQRRKRAAATA